MAKAYNHGFSPDKVAEFKDAFDMWNADGNAHLDHSEMVKAMKSLGDFNAQSLEQIMKEVDANKDGVIDFDEFMGALWTLHTRGDATAFGKMVKKQIQLIAVQTASGGMHSYAVEEISAFANHLNYCLGDDPDLAYLMPINPEGNDLFEKIKDGILLAKFINVIEPDTIDWRAVNFKKGGGLNQFKIIENNLLCISAAKSIGLRVTTSAEELRDADKNQTLVLGLMWQAVKMQLLGSINLKAHPELVRLLQDGEEMSDLLALPPEDILKRWVNYHLAKEEYPDRIKNFSGDIKDAKVYTVLLKSIAPETCDKSALSWTDDKKRARKVLTDSEKIGAKVFIKDSDIVSGNPKLNMAYTASLFNARPGLEPLKEEEKKELAGLMDDDAGDSREERAFRMWMNTLGLGDDFYINNLFEDCRDGLALLKTIDKIEPGIVKWKQVEKNPKNKFKKLGNCNYAVVLGKQLKLSLVTTGGSDVVDANKKLLLGFTWQLMRYHMLKFLRELGAKSGKNITDEDIVNFCNEKAAASGKKPDSIRAFNDGAIASGKYFINLLAGVQPEIINWELVTDGATDEDRMLNARYAISIARKLGCVIFLLPEDIIEVRPKMCLTFGAAVMTHVLRK